MFSTGLRIGRYELKGQLGEGGFGVVYIARDLNLDRDVALKFLLPEHTNNAHLLTRFLQEARAAARIPHPGIVTVFECGQFSGTGTNADGVAFIAMELLHGEALSDRLKRMGGRLAPEVAVAIARQMASALAAAHREGIVHRDLKPDNVFLVRDPAMPSGERVKILDFGIAKLAEKQQPANAARTHSLMLLGTPLYMSPEQCRSAAHVDHRSDIYSLGCIVFEMLCGRTPFDGEVGELIAKHQMEPAPSMRTILPQIPDGLERLVASMLVKDPAQRLGSMAEVEHALQHVDTKALQTVMLPPDVAAGTSGVRPITTLGGAAGMTAATVASGRRMSLIAGLLVVLVIGAGVAVFATSGGEDAPPPPAAAAAVTPAHASAPVVTSIPIDAAVDAPIDAAIDAPVDASIDAAVDAGVVKKPAKRPTTPIKDDVLDPFGN
ncbi:MAG: serine/threonine protein kinase [Deltaproteobacteria bacterium]|nr:serine/threonine protein kinase [Deltaproteobacteria bacterium]